MTQKNATEYDSPWKEIIEQFFEDFMIFFFPKVHQEIDWTVKPEFLEQELQKVMRDAVTKTRRVDKLVKVWLTNGHEILLYIHIEVQSQRDSRFEERMFIYHYRLYDRYGPQVTSLAILGDDIEVWRPRSYHYETLGSELSFCFSMVKLLDYQDKLAELDNSRNPFAMVVKVHLKALETQKSPQERLNWKVTLFKALYEEQDYSEREMWGLCAFLDWVFTLPNELTLQFDDFVKEYEEAKKMRYVTTWERRGFNEGVELGILQKSREDITDILEVRFQQVPKTLEQKLDSFDDTSWLSQLHKKAVLVGSLEEFEQLIEK
ncbi:MAG TPA: cytosolic protein [Gammaproteobacteria bacterium]|nr:cytosolic protein [Gammaproteobacteria bacterium]